VSIELLGKPIALGRTAEIYAWDEGHVLKLFRDWCPAEWAKEEAEITRAIHASGLPVPAVGEVIKLNGRNGLIYERIDGLSMLEAFKRKPWTLFRSARLFAELHVAMHAYSLPQLPSQKQRLERKIRAAKGLSVTMQDAALLALQTMPDGDALCHGDFHPDNILVTARGPIIIDWSEATRGNPLADVARTSLLLSLGAPPPGTPASARWLLEAGRHWVHKAYLKRYFQRRPDDRQPLTEWEPVIAAARLSEQIPEEEERLLALVRAGLYQA
jgi:uncharacterized protein (TIGR02172 family)